MCSGFNQKHGVQIQSSQRLLPDDSSKAKALPCFPASVIYGHAAARGLDIGQWTFGLDTGCVCRPLIPVFVFYLANFLYRFMVES